MEQMRPKFTRIKGLSEIRRLPRLGKIRLGVKATSSSGTEYPRETDYFVCPPEVREVIGDQPKELEIMFPMDDPDIVFPQRLAWFGKSKGAKCMGDGETAIRIEEPDGMRYTDWTERACPCDLFDKQCFRRASLLVMLPKVSMGGVYQIDFGSYYSIVNVNSSLDYIRVLVGKISLIPLKLKRIPTETFGPRGKETHYILNLHFEGNIEFVNQLREGTSKTLALPHFQVDEPDLENPEMDEGPTEEEANEAARKAGMIPGGEPARTFQPPPPVRPKLTDADTKIVAAFKAELVRFTGTVQELIKWFNAFKRNSRLSVEVIQEMTILVNEKVDEIKNRR